MCYQRTINVVLFRIAAFLGNLNKTPSILARMMGPPRPARRVRNRMHSRCSHQAVHPLPDHLLQGTDQKTGWLWSWKQAAAVARKEDRLFLDNILGIRLLGTIWAQANVTLAHSKDRNLLTICTDINDLEQ